MDTNTTAVVPTKKLSEKFVTFGLVVLVALALGYIMSSQYQRTKNAVDGLPRNEIALPVALAAFSAISKAVGSDDKIQIVDCYGSETRQVSCKASGNVLHITEFESPSAIPNFKLHAVRGVDGKFLELELLGVSDKIKPNEIEELLQIFRKPANKDVTQSSVNTNNEYVDESKGATSRQGLVIQNNVNGNNLYDGASKNEIGHDGVARQNNVNGDNVYVARSSKK